MINLSIFGRKNVKMFIERDFELNLKKKRRNANLLALSFCEFTTCRHAGDEDEVYCITYMCCRRLVSNRSPSVSH